MSEKILIVDDDLETIRLIGMVLQRQGYQIITATNGSEAISLASKEQPNLVLLDLMMPDMDGNQVTRRLRENPRTSKIHILMFSAKGQVEDKVSGYEAGIDEYLTKPIHPAELVARIKSVLSRSTISEASSIKKGYTIGLIAAKGGLGTSTLALNLGISIFSRAQKGVICTEVNPGHGCWAAELGYSSQNGLVDLLAMKVSDITPSAIENQLVSTPFGIRLLLSSNHIKDTRYMSTVEQMEVILQQLPLLVPVTILDIGSNYFPHIEKMLAPCNEILVVTDPFPNTVKHTKALIDELVSQNLIGSKLLNVVIVNRVQSSIMLNRQKVKEMLGQDIIGMISPAPELSYLAGTQALPMIKAQPENLVSVQINELGEQISNRIREHVG
jgi:CheY-like chemotaxis protein/MinD-like ATPase involved in chromosome partitioning or flagellar assembly